MNTILAKILYYEYFIFYNKVKYNLMFQVVEKFRLCNKVALCERPSGRVVFLDYGSVL